MSYVTVPQPVLRQQPENQDGLGFISMFIPALTAWGLYKGAKAATSDCTSTWSVNNPVPQVPANCWAKPGFSECQAWAISSPQAECQQRGADCGWDSASVANCIEDKYRYRMNTGCIGQCSSGASEITVQKGTVASLFPTVDTSSLIPDITTPGAEASDDWWKNPTLVYSGVGLFMFMLIISANKKKKLAALKKNPRRSNRRKK